MIKTITSLLWKHRINILVLVLICLVGYWFVPEPLARQDIVIATGTQGGSYYPLGQQMAFVLRELSGEGFRSATALETAGSLDNLKRLTAPRNKSGAADMAFVQYTALANAEPAVRDAIRAIAVLCQDVVQVISCVDLEDPQDLSGKRIYIGKDGSANKLAAQAILEANDVSENEYIRVGTTAGFGEAAELLIAGEADATLFMSGMPTPAVTEAHKPGFPL